MRISKISARLLSVVLAVMMLFSLVTVGFTSASAAKVEVAETGATIPEGTVLYLKPNSNWVQSSAWFAMYTWGTDAATWVKMEKVDDSSTTVYKATMPAGTRDKVIFCRMNPSATALDWASKWDQSVDLTYDGTNNCWAPASGQWNNASGSWSVYYEPQPATAPATPEAPTVTFNNTLGGTGTEADPYLVTPEEKTSMIVSGTLGEATGLAYNVNYTASKVDWAAGSTSILYEDLSAPALDATLAVNVYLWAYNATATDKAYSAEYATTTVYIKGYVPAESSEDEPVVDNTYAIPYEVTDGLYAYAGTEVAGTNAWQRWHEADGIRHFFLPTSASATEVIVLNTYDAAVLLNGVMIPAHEYATVPYVDGTTYTCSGATTQQVYIAKTDAEGTLFVNSADGMTTINDDDAKTETEVNATYDLYAFLTGGSKNREVKGASGAVASEENGINEEASIKKMKGRGNTTWSETKKPFNITYDSNIQLDGMKGKKWSLLANAKDGSLLRNRLVFDMANEIGMTYACDSRFVDFFVNGYYKGSYQLTQKIEMGKNTVMPDLTEPEVEDVIEDDGTITEYPKSDFDFILELDTEENAANAGDKGFNTTEGQWMTYKTPDSPAAEQIEFIKAKYQALEDALYGNDMAALEQILDLDDFAKAYLINEISKNIDSGVTSCYFTYNSTTGMFYASPVWDYDNSIGNLPDNSARTDMSGNTLDLDGPAGWYARELKHYARNARSVFSQAWYNTSTTADGKTFEDIVLEVWNSEFADIVDILNGEATANGRLQSYEAYMANLSKTGTWNQKADGAYVTADWKANKTSLTMYSFDAEANTYTTTAKSYDATFEGETQYATDWTISRINWMAAQYAGASMEVPDGYVTIYFENNWAWPDAKIYYWGSTIGTNPEWNGIALTNIVGQNDQGFDIYEIVIPADITGMLFNGTGEYGAEQSADIKDSSWVDGGICYYMTYDAATDTKPCGTYPYTPVVEETTAPAETVPAETTTTVVEETTTAATADETIPAETTTAAPVVEEYITIYFSNSWAWTDVRVHTFGSAYEADTTWPGKAMTLLYTNDYGQEVYSATIAADVTGINFTGLDNGTLKQSADIVPEDGYGYYMDWSEEEGNHTDKYLYEEPTVETTTSAATADETTTAPAEETTTDAEVSEPETPTYITVYVVNSANWAELYAHVCGVTSASDTTWPGLEMTKTEETVNGFEVYTITLEADYTGIVFNNNNNGSQTADLTIEDGKYYDIKSKAWYASAEEVPVPDDTVASNVYLAGTMNSWSTVADEFMYAGEGETVATLTLTLEANTTYEFKVVKSGAWLGNDGTITESVEGWTMKEAGDCTLTTAAAGEYVFAFDTATDKLSVTYPESTDDPVDSTTPDEEEPEDVTYYIHANFNLDGAEWNDVTLEGEGTVITATVELPAGEYKFKIADSNDVWYGNNGTFTDTCEGWTMKVEEGDCTFIATGGTYTFTFDTETKKVSVDGDYYGIHYAATWDEADIFTVVTDMDATAIKENTDFTFTVEVPEGYIVAGVIANMETIYADENGVYTITMTEDVAILVVTAEEVVVPETKKTFTVMFVDYDNTILAVAKVEEGTNLPTPDAPTRDGYEFTGWSQTTDNVTKDMIVVAQYKKIVTPVEPATEGTLRIEVAGGTGFTIAIGEGNARPQGTSYMNTKAPIGATVTVVANASENTFLGWVNANGLIVSTDATYSFTTTGDDYLKAMYQIDIAEATLVIFKNDKANQILDMQYYVAGDEITFPAYPTNASYLATGWTMSAEEIAAAVAAGEAVVVTPVWERILVYVNVTVNGGTATGITDGKALKYSQVIATAEAAPAGQKFAYWADENGNILSYLATYTFYPGEDITVTSVYVAEDAEIEYEIILNFVMDTSAESPDTNPLMLSWEVIESDTVKFVQAGALVVESSKYNETTFVKGTTDTNVTKWTPGAANQIPVKTISANKKGVANGSTWIGQGWITVEINGEQKTIYTDLMYFEKL